MASIKHHQAVLRDKKRKKKTNTGDVEQPECYMSAAQTGLWIKTPPLLGGTARSL